VEAIIGLCWRSYDVVGLVDALESERLPGLCNGYDCITTQRLVVFGIALSLSCSAAEVPRAVAFTNRSEVVQHCGQSENPIVPIERFRLTVA